VFPLAAVTDVKIANLHVVAANIGAVIRNRLAKQLRHYSSRLRRTAKRSSERAKNTRTHLRQAAERRRDDVEHVRAAAVRQARYWGRLKEQLLEPMQHDLSIRRELRAVAAGHAPIVVGPWLSEVGYEVLYWVPFVRWFVHQYRVDPARLVVVSRGGVGAWYADVTSQYVELLDLFDADDFAARNRERQAAGDQKQLAAAGFDAEILRRLDARDDARGAALLHPSLMFRLLRRFWLGNATLEYALHHLRFAPVSPAAALPIPDLPDRFTAVKFYTGTAIRDTIEHRRLLRSLVEHLAGRAPVVTLGTGLRLDEHEDFLFGGLPNVITLDPALRPQVNLGVQTEVIRRSSLFVGTAGSLAWLAPMVGVDTVAAYADDRLLGPHFYAARYAYASIPAGRFMPLDLETAARFQLAGDFANVR
jgi:hypothetical protein